MLSTIDQIRKDSKNVRDFVKNVLTDRDFKKMKTIKSLLSILNLYTKVLFREHLKTTFHPPLGLNHHLLKKTKNPRKHDDDIKL